VKKKWETPKAEFVFSDLKGAALAGVCNLCASGATTMCGMGACTPTGCVSSS